MSNRILTFMLALVVAFVHPITTLAESGGLPGGSSHITYIKPSGSGVPNPEPVMVNISRTSALRW